MISLDSVPATRASFDVFRASWREVGNDAPLPLMGLGRFIVVAETDAEALALARRAYPRWHASFTHLHRLHNYTASHPRPSDFDGIAKVGQGVAGSPSTVLAFLREQLAGDRQQLLRRTIRVWRSVAGGNAALDCAVRARRYPDVAKRRESRSGLIFIAPSL